MVRVGHTKAISHAPQKLLGWKVNKSAGVVQGKFIGLREDRGGSRTKIIDEKEKKLRVGDGKSLEEHHY